MIREQSIISEKHNVIYDLVFQIFDIRTNSLVHRVWYSIYRF